MFCSPSRTTGVNLYKLSALSCIISPEVKRGSVRIKTGKGDLKKCCFPPAAQPNGKLHVICMCSLKSHEHFCLYPYVYSLQESVYFCFVCGVCFDLIFKEK